jgi:hypothetical protein
MVGRSAAVVAFHRVREPLHWEGWIEQDTDFHPIRTHPRFQKIVETVGAKS